MLSQGRRADGSEVYHLTSIRQFVRYESAVSDFFPNGKTWTGCVPYFHYFLISSFPSVQPFKQFEDEHFHSVIYSCVCGHVHPAIATLPRAAIAFAMRSASLPTPTTVAELIAYR